MDACTFYSSPQRPQKQNPHTRTHQKQAKQNLKSLSKKIERESECVQGRE